MFDTKRSRGKTLAAGVLVLAAWCGSYAQESSPAAEESLPPPRIEVENKLADLGQVRRGDEVETVFILKNTGGRPLEILKAKPG
jgi:hypothetical protein